MPTYMYVSTIYDYAYTTWWLLFAYYLCLSF